jgi:putative FmdB family regulatory protein
MPTYEYRCHSCGEIFSAVRVMADRKKRVRCACCGSASPKLVPSLCSFTLQGGGWAAQGYSSSSGGKKT